jgi:hypothetical protein
MQVKPSHRRHIPFFPLRKLLGGCKRAWQIQPASRTRHANFTRPNDGPFRLSFLWLIIFRAGRLRGAREQV